MIFKKNKTLFGIFLIVLIFFVLLFVRFIFGGDEDTWICRDGKWIKHGNPSFPPPEEVCLPGGENIVGGDHDEHGCIGSAGYTWCEEKQKCLRVWEEPCNSIETE